MCRLTCNHKPFEGEICCGRYVDLLAATAQEILLLAASVYGSYAELATGAEEVQRPPQLLQAEGGSRSSSQYRFIALLAFFVPDRSVYAMICFEQAR